MVFENTKITPVFNFYQYAVVFLTAIMLDGIIHYFSYNKYCGLKSGTQNIGFLPELNVYYRSLSKYGPFQYTQGSETFYNSCNSWIIGMLITGLLCTIIVILSDIILYYIENKKISNNK